MITPLDERDPFRLGLAAAAVLVAAVLVTIGFGSLGLGQARYAAEFVQAGDIRPGDPVRVAGMDVGEITSTGLEGDHVLVRFRIQRSVAVGSTSTAAIKLSTLLGGRYLELRPSGPGSPADDRIPLSHTSVPYDLQKVLQTGTPLLEQLDPHLMHDALASAAGNLRGDGPRIGAALDGLTRLSEVVERRRDQVSHLLTSADQVTELLNRRGDRLYALAGRSDQLLAELLRRRDTIRGTLGDLASLTGQLRAALAENRPRIGPLLTRAERLTDVLHRQDDAVDRALELLAPAGRYLSNAVGNGPYLDVYLPYSIVPDNVLCRFQLVRGCR